MMEIQQSFLLKLEKNQRNNGKRGRQNTQMTGQKGQKCEKKARKNIHKQMRVSREKMKMMIKI